MFLHIDIDSFFISAERIRNKSLRGVPAAVGSRSNLEIFEKKRMQTKLYNDNNGAFVTPVFYGFKKRDFDSYFVDGNGKIRGIITTASYEAREYGIKTGMPIAIALKKLPTLKVVVSDLAYYHRLSHTLYRFLRMLIPAVEQYSIDEFFADISGWVAKEESYLFALKLQYAIYYRFKLPISIGIAKSKWVAKLATESAKPFGIYKVDDIQSFIEDIPIEEFPGIGRGFKKRLKEHGIHTLGDVARNRPLLYRYKKPGIMLYKRILGIDKEGITSKGAKKSIGISRTFDAIYDEKEIKRRIVILARHICFLVYEADVTPMRYYLKITYKEGVRSKGNIKSDRVFGEIYFKSQLLKLYDEITLRGYGAIKIAVRVGEFAEQKPTTYSLFELKEAMIDAKESEAIYRLRKKYGIDILKSASELL